MKEINRYIEHTLLKPDSTAKDIEKLALEAIENDFLGICINPNYVSLAKSLTEKTDIKVVTVVNFPLANNKIDIILAQVEHALKDGADEIDTVINLAELKNKNYKKVESDILKTKEICDKHNLKVIIETDLLTKEEIIAASKCAIEGKADFVKTSTGFVKGGIGAKVEDVKLMYETVSPYGLNVKASGGIKTYSSALELIKAGAMRLGTSSGINIVKERV